MYKVSDFLQSMYIVSFLAANPSCPLSNFKQYNDVKKAIAIHFDFWMKLEDHKCCY